MRSDGTSVVRLPVHGRATDGAGVDGLAGGGHVVRFHDAEEFLVETAARFVDAGLARGERALVVASEARRDAIAAQLDARVVYAARASGALSFVGAEGRPWEVLVGAGDDHHPGSFDAALACLLRELWKGEPRGRTRAYVEAPASPWLHLRPAASTRLQERWGRAARDHRLSLLCAFAATPLRDIAVQPRGAALERPVDRGREIEALPREALVERSRLEAELRASVAREREARARAEANDEFKETFLALLGHELRNPLNTVLTTARLMTMRRDLPPEPHRRLERIVQSGVRMQRLIDQLLDVTRSRLAGGIPVDPVALPDVVPIVAKIVDEIRSAHPDRSIELVAPRAAPGQIDPHRLGQVASNLVGNAVIHTAAGVPVRVDVDGQAGAVLLRVHNGGAPIDPALLPTLFDPFQRAVTPVPRGAARDAGRHGAGLGLGLYISDCIVRAHGGTLAVTSSEDAGTRFDAWFPPIR